VIVDAFLGAAASVPPPDEEGRARLETALNHAVARTQSADLGVEVSPDELAVLVGEIVNEAPDPGLEAVLERIERLAMHDLALALGCGRGDARALARFARLHLQDLPGIVRRIGHGGIDHDEVRARVQETLFVAPPGGRPRILELVGRGNLSGLVRVVAVRTALNLARKGRREVTEPDDALATAIASQTDLEHALVKVQHRGAVKAALENAIADLTADERNLLRLSLLHRLTIDEIAALQHIHRSTAARRIARIREQLGESARRRLRSELGASEGELDHVLHMVGSSLQVSFDRLLAG
jgi:RNA polymerase sigma-70 factor, ECF subfamily